jgi:fused signal recognition particle receptor
MLSLFRRKAKTEEAAANFPAETKPHFLLRLRQGLEKSTAALGGQLQKIFGTSGIDDQFLTELEELLITADLGAKTSAAICQELRLEKIPVPCDAVWVRQKLAAIVAQKLSPFARQLQIPADRDGPYVIMISGVNGAGKTTTIGKMAHQLAEQGFKVMVAAGDTFRAAAREQLAEWAKRSGVTYFEQLNTPDPAALAYAALDAAVAGKFEVLLIDTAGRLQSNFALMEQLAKIPRVLQKRNKSLPQESLLILDATTGQNAIDQVEAFAKAIPLTGLIVTKLDGTAKAGVIVPITAHSQLPVVAIGIGEGIEDLQAFDPVRFSQELLGLEGKEKRHP